MTQDIETFEQILRDTQHMVRAYIAGLGASSDEVDDIAQDVYVAFYNGMHKMPADTTPIRWLKGIARNLCMSHFRKTKRERAQRSGFGFAVGQSADVPHGMQFRLTLLRPLGLTVHQQRPIRLLGHRLGFIERRLPGVSLDTPNRDLARAVISKPDNRGIIPLAIGRQKR